MTSVPSFGLLLFSTEVLSNTKPSQDTAVVSQALKIARHSPDGAQDKTICKILGHFVSKIWAKVEANPQSYVMARDEFPCLNSSSTAALAMKKPLPPASDIGTTSALELDRMTRLAADRTQRHRGTAHGHKTASRQAAFNVAMKRQTPACRCHCQPPLWQDAGC